MKFIGTCASCMRKTVWTVVTSPGGVLSSRQQFLEECEPPGDAARLRLGYESNGLSRSALQRALLVVILLTSIRGIKNFTRCNALSGVNCNYLHEWIFGLPLNLKQF